MSAYAGCSTLTKRAAIRVPASGLPRLSFLKPMDANISTLIDGWLAPLGEHFKSSGKRLVLVGGAIRDHLLGQPINDYDFVTDATRNETESLLAGTGYSPFRMTHAHQIVGFVHNRTMGQVSCEALPQDAKLREALVPNLGERDFTVNSMAVELPGGTLHDPFRAWRDLAEGMLRTPSTP
jgi:poly(A) polymerase